MEGGEGEEQEKKEVMEFALNQADLDLAPSPGLRE